jgi:hypothetical protein
MADDTATMHQDFPRWYAPLSVEDDKTRRYARFVSVSRIAASANRDLVEALIRLAFSTRQMPVGGTASLLLEAIKAEDDTFDPTTATQEFRVLAGATLHLLFERNDDLGAAAALSVTTTYFSGARVPKLPLDIICLAEAALERIADKNRTRPDVQALMNGRRRA